MAHALRSALENTTTMCSFHPTLTVLVSLLSLPISAQNLNGEWNGILFQEPQKKFVFRMNIEEAADGSLSGTTFIQEEGKNANFGTMAFSGKLDGTRVQFKESVILKEQILSNSFFWCLKSGTLSLKDYGSFWALEGPWTASNCNPGTVLLRKNKPQPVKTEEPPRTVGSNILIEEEDFPTARPVEILNQGVTLKATACRIRLWDAARVDGDVVTLVLNGKVLARRLHIPSKKEPWNLEVVLQPGENTLVMHVDDIGTHAPNTASLSLYDGESVQTIVLRSYENSSQGIRIVVEE